MYVYTIHKSTAIILGLTERLAKNADPVGTQEKAKTKKKCVQRHRQMHMNFEVLVGTLQEGFLYKDFHSTCT